MSGEIERVGVSGFGLMGGGIAQVCALAGFDTLVLDVGEAHVERGQATIRARLERDVARDRITRNTCDRSTGPTPPPRPRAAAALRSHSG